MRSLIAAKRMPSVEEMDLQCVLRARGLDDIADELLLAAEHPAIQAIKVIGVPSVDPPIQASQTPIDHPYASGKLINLGVTTIAAAGGAAQADLVTAGYQYLTVMARLGNATTPATAAADLAFSMQGFEDDDTTPFPNPVSGPVTFNPDLALRAISLTTNVAYIAQRYLLAGISKMRGYITNNNATTALQGGTIIYFLQK